MNKKLLLCLSMLFAVTFSDAQEVKRYLTFEHFTNTVCSICSSRNPPFFQKLDEYPNDVHHISFHPPVPYSSCQLYQHNPNGNAGRASYYGVNGTPKVWLNGSPTGNPLITDEAIEEAKALTSPIGFEVTEGTGDTRDVSVEVRSFAEVPTGNYKLYVAVVEERLNYNSPNGESVHHNVFRQWLVDGDDFTPAATGESVINTYQYTLDTEWVAEEMYVLAYLQDDDTKEIVNSGTRFDPGFTTSNKDLTTQAFDLEIAPNPTTDQLFIRLDAEVTNNALLQLQDATGRSIWQSQNVLDNQSLDVSDYPAGIYFLRLQNGADQIVKKVVIR